MPLYYIRNRGKAFGPFDEKQLKAMRYKGQLSQISEISENKINWKPASDFEFLFPAAPPVKVQQPSSPAAVSPSIPPSYQQQSGLPITEPITEELSTLNNANILRAKHIGWTLWFWIPFGAVFGWLHIAFKTFRKEFFLYAFGYSIACALPYCLSLSSLNLGVIIVVPWIVGLVHVYATFNETFIKTIDSIGRKTGILTDQETKRDDKKRYDLNTATYDTFYSKTIKNVPDEWAEPILAERCNNGPFADMDDFFKRCRIRDHDKYEKVFFIPSDTEEYEPHMNPLIVSFVLILPVLITVFCFCAWRMLENEPELKQHVYSFMDWDYYKNVEGHGSGVTRDEALYHAKVDALSNGIGADLVHKEIGKDGIVTISTDEGDKTAMMQDASEEFTKSVHGRVSDVEIVHEDSLKDGTYRISIKAKVLFRPKKKKEQ